jgi:hypothetical protein
VSVVTGERPDHAARVGLAAQRERRQVERGRPSLRPRLQPLDVFRGQIEFQHVVEKRPRLLVIEAKLAGAQLGELATGTQPTQRQRRIVTCRQNNPKRVREALDQVGEPFLDLHVRDQVVVVEHENDSPVESSKIVQEQGQNDLNQSCARGPVCRQRPRPDLRFDRAQRRNQVGEETHGVVVVVVE